MLEISKCDTSIISVSIGKKLMIDIIKTFVPNEKIADIGEKAFMKLDSVIEAPLSGKLV